MPDKRIIIGLVGMPGSGKTTIAKILGKSGFKIITLSAFIKEELVRKNIKVNRKNLQDMGDKLREKEGADILAKEAAESIKKENLKKAVIDGIRNLAEIKYLEKTDDFYLIGVSATPDKRFKRLLRSDKYNSLTNWQDFIYYEIRENGGINTKVGQQNMLCYLNSKFFIDNSETLKNLTTKVNKLLKRMSNEN
jgi:dephospho-CoA kinase